MNSRKRIWASACLLALSAPEALAQVPKISKDYYEDHVELGFKIKKPKGWDEIPAQPGDPNRIVSYSAPHNSVINLSPKAYMLVEFDLVRFARKRSSQDDGSEAGAGAEQTRSSRRRRAKNALAWIEDAIPNGRAWHPDPDSFPGGKPRPLKGVKGVDATYIVYEAQHSDDPEVTIKAYVAEYDLGGGLRIAAVGTGPGDRKWRKYEKVWSRIAKTFVPLGVDRPTVSSESRSPRAAKRAKLEREVARLEGWELYETPNYFVVTDNDDEEFIEELLERLEAIRAVYERDYPPSKARLVKRETPGPEGTSKPQDGPSPGEASAPADDERSVSAVDPLLLSRTSVVRVCKDRTTYHKYGGPGGSAGYWNSGTEELVIYDDKAGGGRRDTWITLNHEAFHQYIFYFYGNISPHSWYNEGTGDFYSGYQLKHGKFILKENPWRNRTAQEMIRTGEYAPLRDIVRWTQSQYYGNNDLGLHGGQCYAQGWSIIYFLRTGPQEKYKGWNPAWSRILDTYLETLAKTGDLDKAVDAAFDGVDWDALEACWKRAMG